MKRDLLSILDLSPPEIHRLIDRGREMKTRWQTGELEKPLSGKILGLIFVKPSTRTRVSFETAMYRLGGQCIFMAASDMQISRQEPMADTARVLSRYINAIVIRTFAQKDVEDLARFASIPVINGLTDRYHPCQVLSDLLTIKEKLGSLEGIKVAWIGDGNNVAHSWINAAIRLGFSLVLACPQGYEPDEDILSFARNEAKGNISLVRDPREAVLAADVLYTDVWASMGQEAESQKRKVEFQNFQINEELLALAPPHAMVMHCLPAHRGEEITDGVIEGPQSIVFDQAENRLYLQMALLEWLMSSKQL